MPRKKSKVTLKPVKIETLSIKEVYSIRTMQEFHFFKIHEEPSRPPIVNIIRKRMIEINWGKKNYDDMEEKYGLEQKRIQNSLSSKYEPVVSQCLCEYLGITKPITFRDKVANYDFEQKEVCKRTGNKSDITKAEFISEFEKSWSDETYAKYMQELEYDSSIDIVCTDDEVEEKIADARKKTAFLKLLRIYDEYPDVIERFCEHFVENEEE